MSVLCVCVCVCVCDNNIYMCMYVSPNVYMDVRMYACMDICNI